MDGPQGRQEHRYGGLDLVTDKTPGRMSPGLGLERNRMVVATLKIHPSLPLAVGYFDQQGSVPGGA